MTMRLIVAVVIIVVALFAAGTFPLAAAKKGKPPEIDESVRTNFKIPAGTKPFKLSCPIRDADPDDGIIVRWTKDEEEINSAEWNNTPYRLLNGDLDLKIRNPQVSDSGRYRCMLVNGFGHKKVEFTLQVYDANSARREPSTEAILLSDRVSSPIWHDRNAIDMAVKQPLRLTRGKRLELRCPASGNPLPKIFWTKNGERINLELTSSSSAKFVIDNVDVEDSGVYACRLENTLGSLEADFRVFVSSLDDTYDDNDAAGDIFAGETDADATLFGANANDKLPILSGGGNSPTAVATFGTGLPQPVIDQPYNTTVGAGHTAQFQCKVQWRKDVPTMRWLRKIDNPTAVKATTPNATILHIHGMHLLVLDQQHGSSDGMRLTQPTGDTNSEAPTAFINKLLIPNVQRADAGRYFCVVTNAAGQFVFRSAYLDVVQGNKFALFATSINVAIALIVAVALTLVTLAVVWLCYNSSDGGDAHTGIKSITMVAPHQFSSTSSTSSSTSAAITGAPSKSLSGPLLTPSDVIVDVMPTGLYVNNNNNNSDAIKLGDTEMSHTLPPQPPPPPPPQIPLPPAPPLIAPNNTPASVISTEMQQQLLFQHHQQQQQRLLYLQQQRQQQQQLMLDNNNFTHCSQTQLHHDVRSPLLGTGDLQAARQLASKASGNGMSIGELLYPSTMTLDRRYGASQKMMPSHMLRRTRAEDEVSRVSRHIYEILAENTPLPPPSPTATRRHNLPQQQVNDNNNNNNFNHRDALQPPVNCSNSMHYLPTQMPPPPPNQRVATPATNQLTPTDENDAAISSTENTYGGEINFAAWNAGWAFQEQQQQLMLQHQQRAAALHYHHYAPHHQQMQQRHDAAASR